jgi:hypothetical protein
MLLQQGRAVAVRSRRRGLADIAVVPAPAIEHAVAVAVGVAGARSTPTCSSGTKRQSRQIGCRLVTLGSIDVTPAIDPRSGPLWPSGNMNSPLTVVDVRR